MTLVQVNYIWICFDTNFHKELQNHKDNILIEFEVVDDQFNDGFIYCYEISNADIDIVEEILKKHGFNEYT